MKILLANGKKLNKQKIQFKGNDEKTKTFYYHIPLTWPDRNVT